MWYPDPGGHASFTMPTATRKRRVAPPEDGEMESPPEDVREGSEEDQTVMPIRQQQRKRSVKSAKKTKAPMDSEGCGCSGGKKKPCSCSDSDCTSSKKMDSALTPQEYLDACDLGIQDRSRSYIRTRLTVMDSLTPVTVQLRFDKKCGGSAIPDNKQCRVGAGGAEGWISRNPRKAVVGGIALGIGAAAAIKNRGAIASAARGAVGRMRSGGGASSSAIVPYRGGGGRMPSNLSRNGVGNRVRRAAYNAGSAVRSAATNIYEGPRSGSFTPAGSIGNRVRRLRNSNIPRSAGMAARRAGQGLQSAVNSARFATRSGAGFTAGNSIGNTARRAVYGGSMAIRRGAARMSARRPRSITGGLAIRRGDDVWAEGFTPQYA